MSCCDVGGLLPVDDALSQLLALATKPVDIEMVNLHQSLGRVLAEDQLARVNVPPCDNSAMDGYAFRFADLTEQQTGQQKPLRFEVSQRIPAGANPTPLAPGTAARIFTGAPIPQGADCVVMQEDCVQEASEQEDRDQQQHFVVINQFENHPIKLNQNIRPQGQDIAQDSQILSTGHRLQPQDIGLLASIGVASMPVFKKLKVAIFSTGDELVEPGNPIRGGQIYNSNRHTMAALLQALQCEVIDLGVVEDNFEATQLALTLAAQTADVVMTSGGVSVGEEDHIKTAVESLGQLDLWKLAIKPGKPFALGRIKNTPFIGLPGNPVAVMVTFMILARPFLLASQGIVDIKTPISFYRADFSCEKTAKRREYLRVKLAQNPQGEIVLQTYPNQSSGVLSSLSWAEGLAIREMNCQINAGDKIPFLSFTDLIHG